MRLVIARLVHNKVTQQNKVLQLKETFHDKLTNSHLTKYLTSPIDGTQTTIPLMMYDEYYQNYYPDIQSKSKKITI